MVWNQNYELLRLQTSKKSLTEPYYNPAENRHRHYRMKYQG
jgi:hypothetical protein